MKRRSVSPLGLLLVLAGLACTLALPWREDGAQRSAANPPGPLPLAELRGAWRAGNPGQRAELLSHVGECGDPSGLEFLAWVATFEPGAHDAAVARAVQRLAPLAREPREREALESLCDLLASPDPACVQALSRALAGARVDAAVPPWIELLASESRGMRERARRSLEEFSGLALGETAERWLAWHAGELDWFEERFPLVLEELESEDDGRVLAAVRELAPRRLHRDELALAVEGLLEYENPTVRVYVCRVLAGLGSPVPVPALVRALEDEDEAVARGAWTALQALTGLELPLDPRLWRERCSA